MQNADQEFRKKCDELSIKYFYEVQQQEQHQQQHIELMDMLEDIPPEFYKLPYNLWGASSQLIDSLADSSQELLWHKCLICCGEQTLKDVHKHANGIHNFSKIKFNDLTHCDNCLKTNLTKSLAGHYSL